MFYGFWRARKRISPVSRKSAWNVLGSNWRGMPTILGINFGATFLLLGGGGAWNAGETRPINLRDKFGEILGFGQALWSESWRFLRYFAIRERFPYGTQLVCTTCLKTTWIDTRRRPNSNDQPETVKNRIINFWKWFSVFVRSVVHYQINCPNNFCRSVIFRAGTASMLETTFT